MTNLGSKRSGSFDVAISTVELGDRRSRQQAISTAQGDAVHRFPGHAIVGLDAQRFADYHGSAYPEAQR